MKWLHIHTRLHLWGEYETYIQLSNELLNFSENKAKRQSSYGMETVLPINCDKSSPVSSVYIGQYHGCWYPGSLRCQDISSHDIDSVEYVGPGLTWGMILSTCVTSMWSNDIKCKCMFLFPLKNLRVKYRWLSVKVMRKHHLGEVMVWSPHWCYCQYTGNLLQSDNLAHIQKIVLDIARSHWAIGIQLKMLPEWEFPTDFAALL